MLVPTDAVDVSLIEQANTEAVGTTIGRPRRLFDGIANLRRMRVMSHKGGLLAPACYQMQNPTGGRPQVAPTAGLCSGRIRRRSEQIGERAARADDIRPYGKPASQSLPDRANGFQLVFPATCASVQKKKSCPEAGLLF